MDEVLFFKLPFSAKQKLFSKDQRENMMYGHAIKKHTNEVMLLNKS